MNYVNRIGAVTEQDVPQGSCLIQVIKQKLQKPSENEQLREIINGNKDGLTEIKNKLLGLKNCDEQEFVDELTSSELVVI